MSVIQLVRIHTIGAEYLLRAILYDYPDPVKCQCTPILKYL